MTLDDETEHPVGDVLRRHYELKISPEVAARHTMTIHREAARLRIEHRRSLRAAGRPRRAVVASLVGAMLVGSSTGALAASEETLPGDVLYSVKRTSEQARLFAAATFAREGLVHLDIARMRVHEAQRAASIRPAEVVRRLKAEAEAALAAAEREGAPNVAQVEAQLLADADEAVALSEATEVAAAPSASASPTVASPSASAAPSPGPSVPAVVPSELASASPTAQPSPEPSPSVPVVVPSPGEPESSTAGVPTPNPSPTATP